MKSVCAKHEQAFEVECPWCEKKAEGPAAAPAAPPAAQLCTYGVPSNTPCGLRAAWHWVALTPEAKATVKDYGPLFMCDTHHTPNAHSYPMWRKERLP